jgi:hypothetical protein
VAYGVRDRLLRDAIDRRTDRRPEVLELTRHLDLHPWAIPDAPGEPLQVRHSRLRDERRRTVVAQYADHGPHLGESPGSLRLDDGEGVHRGLRASGDDGSAGLGPDDDGRDMMGDRVVQLAGQLFTLAQPDLIQLADPRGRPVADRGAESRREEQEHAAENGFDVPGEIADVSEHQCHTDDRQSDGDLAAGSPARQGVRQQHHADHRVQAEGSAAADQDPDVDHDQRPEHRRHHGKRMSAPPQERADDTHSQRQGDGPPHQVMAENAFEDDR